MKKKKWLIIVGSLVGLYIVYSIIGGYINDRAYSSIIEKGQSLLTDYQTKLSDGKLNKDQKDALSAELDKILEEIETNKKEGNKPNNEQWQLIEGLKADISALTAYTWHDFPVHTVEVLGSIEGPLAGLINTSDKTIEVKSAGRGALMEINLKSKTAVSENKLELFDRYYITAQFLNKEQEVITEAGIQSSFANESNGLVDILKARNGVGKIEIGGTSKDKYDPEIHGKLIHYIRFSSETQKDEEEIAQNDEIDSDSDDSGLENSDFDKVLDNYEAYVDEYIKFVKKAAEGDMSALSQYPTLMEKAKKLDQRLTKSKGDLTPEQVNRMMQIQLKMTKAAMEMSKPK